MKNSSETPLLGLCVNIKDPWIGDWGIVKGFDGDYYHVAVYNGTTHVALRRCEFTVPRRKKKS